jgi:hypothetical protein
MCYAPAARNRGFRPCAAAFSEMARKRRRLDAVRRAPSSKGRKSTPAMPNSRLRATKCRSRFSSLIVFMDNQFLEPSKVERFRCLGVDPLVAIGPVDLDRKRPSECGLLQQRAAAGRICRMLARAIGNDVLYRDHQNLGAWTDRDETQALLIRVAVEQPARNEFDSDVKRRVIPGSPIKLSDTAAWRWISGQDGGSRSVLYHATRSICWCCTPGESEYRAVQPPRVRSLVLGQRGALPPIRWLVARPGMQRDRLRRFIRPVRNSVPGSPGAR